MVEAAGGSSGRPTAAVVGGGAAGLMAAQALATAGTAVTVYERMPTPGRKLLVAGRGGLNVTNSEDTSVLVSRYGPARPRLAPAVAAFDAEAVRAWCTGLGIATFVGSSGRTFPVGLRSTGLVRAWLAHLDDLGVRIAARHTWRGWSDDGALVFDDGSERQVEVHADATVLAMGGASWPRTGSDGRWVGPVAHSGVGVSPLRPACCGFEVAWSALFAERFAGTPVKDVVVSHRGVDVRGEAMITALGIEGGGVYALAAALRRAVEAEGSAVMSLDLRPDVAVEALADRLARARGRDSTATTLRRAGLRPVAAGLLREVTGNRLPGGRELAALIKDVPVVVGRPFPLDRAIATAGGIRFDELDDRFMLRRRPGTFVAGEMLDWEAPTGGYLLHASLATGVAAAAGVQAWWAEQA